MSVKYYALYDMKTKTENIVGVFTQREMADFLGTSLGVIQSGLSRKTRFKNRYEVVELQEEEENDEYL